MIVVGLALVFFGGGLPSLLIPAYGYGFYFLGAGIIFFIDDYLWHFIFCQSANPSVLGYATSCPASFSSLTRILAHLPNLIQLPAVLILMIYIARRFH